MRRMPTILVLALLLGFGLAQRSVTLAGVITSEEAIPEGTRLGVQVLDANEAWSLEVNSVVPLAGSFELEIGDVPSELLRPFRSGAVLLPGLQNEYIVDPQDVRYAQGVVAMYIDADEDGVWTRQPARDPVFLALSQLERPIGFFSLIYVDKDATMQASGVDLALEAGWNLFSVRFPESGPEYAVTATLDDVKLDVLDVIGR